MDLKTTAEQRDVIRRFREKNTVAFNGMDHAKYAKGIAGDLCHDLDTAIAWVTELEAQARRLAILFIETRGKNCTECPIRGKCIAPKTMDDCEELLLEWAKMEK